MSLRQHCILVVRGFGITLKTFNISALVAVSSRYRKNRAGVGFGNLYARALVFVLRRFSVLGVLVCALFRLHVLLVVAEHQAAGRGFLRGQFAMLLRIGDHRSDDDADAADLRRGCNRRESNSRRDQ